MTVLTLETSGLDDLVLAKSDGYIVRSFEWKSGVVRSVSRDAAGISGAIDTSRFHGAGSVTLGLRLPRHADSFPVRERRLRSFTHGLLRPTLRVDWEDGVTDEMIVTLSQGTVMAPAGRATHRDVVVQFVVPYGIMESATAHVASANASGNDVAGRTYSLTFDRTYPAADPQGSVELTNAGDRDAYPVFRLFGPWSGGASMEHATSGVALVFDAALAVAAGDYLEVDTRNRTILLNGDAAQSYYSYLSFPDSTWWSLAPGPQRVRFVPGSFTSPAQAEIHWRDAYS